MLVIFLIADLERVDPTMSVLAIVTCCDNGGKLGHLGRTSQVRNAKAALYQVPLRGRLDRKINMNTCRIHRRDGRIDLAPIVDSWPGLDFIPVELIAYPANVKLLVIPHKLLIRVYGREAVRARDS